MDLESIDRKISQLRTLADDPGATPGEKQAATRAVERLEVKRSTIPPSMPANQVGCDCWSCKLMARTGLLIRHDRPNAVRARPRYK